MPSISIYLPRDLYERMTKEKEKDSVIIQKALKKMWGLS